MPRSTTTNNRKGDIVKKQSQQSHCCDCFLYDTKRAEKEHIETNIKYHIEFFRNGLNAIIKLWLAGGCQESPKEMADVLKAEYRGR